MSGKALFTYNPELFEDAEGAIDEENYEDEEEEGQEKKIEKQDTIRETCKLKKRRIRNTQFES